MLTDQELKEWVRPVEDPELFLSLVDLGLVYKIEHDETAKSAKADITLTSPGCPAGDQIVYDLKTRLQEHEQIEEAEINIVWEPKWDPAKMASEECKEQLGIWDDDDSAGE